MNYKEITLPQGTIIVDVEKVYKHTDSPKWVYDEFLFEPFNLDTFERINQKGDEYAIVATKYPYCLGKDVPMYKEEFKIPDEDEKYYKLASEVLGVAIMELKTKRKKNMKHL